MEINLAGSAQSAAQSRLFQFVEFPRILVQRVVLSDLFHYRMFALLPSELQRSDLGDGVEREDQGLPDVLRVVFGQDVQSSVPSKV